MMDLSTSKDQQVARELLQRYMTDTGYGVNELARQAGVSRSILSRFLSGKTFLQEGSALRVYCTIERDINVMDRRNFLRSVGLLPLALVLSRDRDLLSDLAVEAHGVAVPGDVLLANRLLVAGHELAQQGLWEAAIQILRRAEKGFGRGSSQAARAAVDIAQLFINLGSYEAAREELQRVEREYARVMDPETRANFHTRRGWLDYYLGDLSKAAERFQAVLGIAREHGIEHLEDARHFLGRTYRDLGALHDTGKARDRWLHMGEQQLRRAFEVHGRCATETEQAFGLLRLSQLKLLQYDWRAAQELRARARQMFGDDLTTLHIDLEEAKLALLDGEVHPAKVRAEKGLDGFRHIKYARGMARALHLLGVHAHVQGRTPEAIEYYVASLAVFPYQSSPAHPQTWLCLDQALWEMRVRHEHDELRKTLHLLHDMAQSRTGPFEELNHVAADRTAHLMEILRRLAGDSEPATENRENRHPV